MTEYDPNADLFRGSEEEKEEIALEDQLWEKNPRRTAALKDLWYGELDEVVNDDKIPEEKKREMVFMMTANSVMDMIMESVPDELALEMTYCFDTFLAVSLTNKKYGTDLFSEMQKALLGIKRDDFPDDVSYEKGLMDAEEAWWGIPQPLLDHRNPNDAVTEMMAKYKLSE